MKSLAKYQSNKPNQRLSTERRKQIRTALLQLRAKARVKQQELVVCCTPYFVSEEHNAFFAPIDLHFGLGSFLTMPDDPGKDYFEECVAACKLTRMIADQSLSMIAGKRVPSNGAYIEEIMHEAQVEIELAQDKESNVMLLPFGFFLRNVGSMRPANAINKSLYLSTLLADLVTTCQQNLYLQAHLV